MRFLFLVLLCLWGCGYSSTNNQLTGQVKKVAHMTPLICPDYTMVDLSLGIMRNGVGSMSNEDKWLVVEDEDYIELLELASKDGTIVDATYSTRRIAFCQDANSVLTELDLP